MHQVFLIGALVAGGIGHAAAAPAPVNPSVDARVVIEQDKRRTYAEVGAENGFTREQWSRLYDQLAGFRYVNGLPVRELPVPVQRVARARRK